MTKRRVTIDGILDGAFDVSTTDGKSKLFYVTAENVNLFIEGLGLIKTTDNHKKNMVRWSLELLEQFKKEMEA